MQKENLKSAAKGGLSLCMANMRLKTKLALGFGLVLVLTGVVVFMGYNGLKNVTRELETAKDASSIATYILEAQGQVKNFQLRGWALHGDDTQNAVEKFDGIITDLETQVEELRGKLYEQEDLHAIAAISENIATFDTAFDESVAAHKEKDGAFADWGRVGWSITEVIGKSMEEIIDPARALAERAGDLDAFAEWTYIGNRLNEDVIQPFLLLRVTAVYFLATEADEQWASYQQQLKVVRAGAAKWATLVQGHPDLEAAAEEIAGHLDEYEKAGERFYAAVLADRNANIAMAMAARRAQQYALNLETAKIEDALAAQSSATAMMLGAAILAIVLGIGIALVISRAITKPVASVQQVAEQVARGDTQVTIDIDQEDEIGQLANAFRGVTETLKAKAETAEQFAQGNLTVAVPLASEVDTLGNAMVIMRDSIQQLSDETRLLTRAAVDGDLSYRGDASRLSGEYAKIVEGFNHTLKAIHEPIKVIRIYLDRISKGDLSKKLTVVDEKTNILKGDFKGLMDDTNRVIESLTQLVTHIKVNANNLEQASDQLATAANQAGEATQQVAGTSQQMASGAADQAASSQETTRAVGQLTEVIDQIARGAQEQSSQVQKAAAATSEASSGVEQVATGAAAAAEGSRKAAEVARNGAEMTRKTVAGMEKIRATVDIASEKVTDLGKRSEQIDKIVSVISDIAAQTNLLALNAAIEAARAGEHGRGFAVVADEVRKLAERSSAATQEIADLIASIQNGVKESVKSMEEGTSEVKEGFRLASEAGNVLEEILRASVDVSEQIEQISAGAQQSSASASQLVKLIDGIGSVSEENMASTEQMSASATQVARSIESVAGIAEQNSAATEQVSASAEEMSAQVQEIVASSQSLKQMSEELQAAVSKFKLNGAGAGVGEKVLVG
ncbi:methyl-accepting chemotaxis protein [Dehalococcoidia bacterium]|nr:methyl-accepting chemotaxis protein [Dehalococcoidia bacterium]